MRQLCFAHTAAVPADIIAAAAAAKKNNDPKNVVTAFAIVTAKKSHCKILLKIIFCL